MSDLALHWDAETLTADLAVEANDLVREDGLRTAVMLSLFTDRRAQDGDPLPLGETDRRGWWGDAVPVVEGDQIGSRLWLLAREKQTRSTLARAEEYAREALAWLLEDRVTDRVDVVASASRPGVLGLEVTIYRPHADPARYRFSHAWTAEEARSYELPGPYTVKGSTPGDAGTQTAAPTLDAFPASPTNVDPVVTTAHGAALAQARVYVGGVEVPLAGGFFDADGLFLVTLLGLSQTTHSVTVTAQAEGEIESDPSNARSVTVDRTAPAAPTITSPATGTTASATETFVFTGEAGCTGYLHVDGVSTEAVESPAGTYTVANAALAVGANVVTATLTDAASNVSDPSAPVTRTRSDALPAEGATLARALQVRAVGRSRVTITDGVTIAQRAAKPGGGAAYPGFWVRDYVLQTSSFPGLFPVADMRGVFDLVMSKIGGDPVGPAFPPEQLAYETATAIYRPNNVGHYPSFDSAPYLALLAVYAYDRGDATIFTANKAAIESMMLAAPRGVNGLIYIDPATPSIGWGWEDVVLKAPADAMITALHAYVYRELARVATASGDATAAADYTAKAAAFVAAISAVLRRPDAFYRPYEGADLHHNHTTAFVVAEGLTASAAERDATAAALLTSYQAGEITYRGLTRHLRLGEVWPAWFPGYEAAFAPGTYLNGGYWHGAWTRWLVKALEVVSGTAARELVQTAISEVLREHRIDGLAPWEWSNSTTRAATATLYGAHGEYLRGATESEPAYVDLTLTAANGYSAEIARPHGHRAKGLTLTSASPQTVTVALEGAPQTNTLGEDIGAPATYGAFASMISLALAAETTKEAMSGVAPVATFGGKLRARVTAGSATADITVRVHLGTPTVTVSGPTVASTFSDPFTVDQLATHYGGTAGWSVADGTLNVATPEAFIGLKPAHHSSADVRMTLRYRAASWAGAPQLRLYARTNAYDAPGAFVIAFIHAGRVELQEYVAGVPGPIATLVRKRLTDGQWYTARMWVRGNRAYVWDDATGQTLSITLTSAGGGDNAIGFQVAGQATAWSLDDLVVEAIGAAPAAGQPIPPGLALLDAGWSDGGQAGVTGDSWSTYAPPLTLRDGQGDVLETIDWPGSDVAFTY